MGITRKPHGTGNLKAEAIHSAQPELKEIGTLKRIVEVCWDKSTSADPDAWTVENSAYGQCAVTALLVQDMLGGKLLRSVASWKGGSVSHYFNELPDGRVLDLTRKQFREDCRFSEPEYRERSYVLSYPDAASRYDILKRRFTLASGLR